MQRDLRDGAGLGTWDVVVMGAGPAGSTAAAMLARAGHRVLVVEKERFPRYHIGESLIPGCLRVLDAIGARGAVEEAGFVVKRGVTFAWGEDGEWNISFDEQQAVPNYAFQVDRSRFDEILLNHARSCGAAVREGLTVRSVDVGATESLVTTDDGVARASYVVDATGQASLLGKKRGERVVDDSLRNVAIWQYYRGCARLPEPRAGNIAIVRHGDGWWWYIPLEPQEGGLTSLGMVLSAETYRRLGADGADIFAQQREATPGLRRWLAGAEPVSEVRTTADWSYRSRCVAGESWLLAGDAAGFIDPLLSTGCYLAMTAGYLAGLCLGSVLHEPELKRAAFSYYRDSYDRVVDEIHVMVHEMYRMMRPQEVFDGAARILDEPGDPRELFVKLAAGLVERSRSGEEGLGGETGLPSEVFGVRQKSIKHYGVPFEMDEDRVLCEVDPSDLPPDFAGPAVLVERNARLRLARESEFPAECDGGDGGRPQLPISQARSDEAAARILAERVPPPERPSAVLVFAASDTEPPVVVSFSPADKTERYWLRVGQVAMCYLMDPGESPLDRPAAGELLSAVAGIARDSGPEQSRSPQSLQEAVAASAARRGLEVLGRASSS